MRTGKIVLIVLFVVGGLMISVSSRAKEWHATGASSMCLNTQAFFCRDCHFAYEVIVSGRHLWYTSCVSGVVAARCNRIFQGTERGGCLLSGRCEEDEIIYVAPQIIPDTALNEIAVERPVLAAALVDWNDADVEGKNEPDQALSLAPYGWTTETVKKYIADRTIVQALQDALPPFGEWSPRKITIKLTASQTSTVMTVSSTGVGKVQLNFNQSGFNGWQLIE